MENLWQDEKEIREEWIDFWRTCRKIDGNNSKQPLMYLTKSVDEMSDWWLKERREAMEKLLIKILAELHTTKYPTEDGAETMRIVRHILKDYLLTLQEKDVR